MIGSIFYFVNLRKINFMELSNIEPQIIWKNFSKLNAVPRPSKKEEKVIAFIKEFGENLGLETTVDEVGNVIIKKPATAGMENRKSVVLQSHLDMVCQKTMMLILILKQKESKWKLMETG
jgi:dipeptidase D